MNHRTLCLLAAVAFSLGTSGCDDGHAPVDHVFAINVTGGPTALTFDALFQTIMDDPTRGTGTVEAQVVARDPATTASEGDSVLCTGVAPVTESSFGVNDSNIARLTVSLGPCTPSPAGHHVYTRYHFDPLEEGRQTTTWRYAGAPPTLGGDGISPGERQTAVRRDEARVEEAAARDARHEALRAGVESISRAVRAIPEEGESVPVCEQSDASDMTSRRGRIVWEDWARRVAGAATPNVLPGCPRQEDRYHELVDRALCQAVVYTRSLAVDAARVYRTSDPVIEVAEALARVGTRLRIVRVREFVEPVVEAGDERGTTFTPGRVNATVFVVDRGAGTVICTAEVSAVSTSSFTRVPDGRDALRLDLMGNLRHVLNGATPIVADSP